MALLFLAAVLNYVDKNSLALLAPTIQKDLGLSDQDYATIRGVKWASLKDYIKGPRIDIFKLRE